MGRFDGRVALVLGGDSTVMRATVEGLVAEGARVFIAADDAAIGALIGRLGHNSVDGIGLAAPGADGIDRALMAAVRRFGRLDIAVQLMAEPSQASPALGDRLAAMEGESEPPRSQTVAPALSDAAGAAATIMNTLAADRPVSDATTFQRVVVYVDLNS